MEAHLCGYGHECNRRIGSGRSRANRLYKTKIGPRLAQCLTELLSLASAISASQKGDKAGQISGIQWISGRDSLRNESARKWFT